MTKPDDTAPAPHLTPAERRKQNRLAQLLDKAKDHVMTPEEIAAQRKSWVCGEMLLQYPTMTYDEASDRYDAITASPAPAPQMPPSERMVDLMGRYWKAAYQQGKEGRHHDDKQASAQIAESNLCAYVDDLRAQLLRMADIAEQRLFEIERLNMALEPFAEAPITAACDAKASEAVEAIFADMRDRRFLKWLFDIDGDANLIGRFDDGEELRGIDLEAQAEIKSAWRSIIAEALAATNAPAPQVMALDDHQEKLSGFLDALDEWGCEDNGERAEHIIEFQRTGYDLDAYLVEHPGRSKSEVN